MNFISSKNAFRFIWLLPGLVFLIFFILRSAYTGAGFYFTLFDDAMISMTYGRTLAETGELVWFPGAEAVQGYTNLLWTLYMAMLHFIGLEGSGAALAVSLSGVVVILATALLVTRLVRRSLDSQSSFTAPTSLLAGAAIPFIYPLVFWTLRGMEVGLMGLLLLLLITGLSEGYRASEESGKNVQGLMLAACAVVCGTLLRLDFSVLAMVILVTFGYFSKGSTRWKQTLIILSSLTFLTVAAILLFQYFYYGDWLPNTYYLKLEGFTVQQRIVRGVLVFDSAIDFMLLVLISMVATLLYGETRAVRAIWLLGSGFLAGCAYSIWVGGDAWEHTHMINRFVTVVLPLGVASVFIALGSLLEKAHLSGFSVPVSVSVALALLIGLLCSIFLVGYMDDPLPLLLGVIVGALCLILLLSKSTETMIVASLAPVLLLVLVTTSAVPFIDWLSHRGLHVTEDYTVAKRSMALKKVTTPDAVIATVWAGQPGYYSKRSMIDLMGKTDRVISREPPNGELYPGHNKWNYVYSIGVLKPDLIFQLWLPAADQEKYLDGWGYAPCLNKELGNVHCLRSSTNIDWSEFR